MIALDYGIPTDKEGLQLRLGVERGFFRDEGIDLNVRIVFGGPEIAAAYDSGALKIGDTEGAVAWSVIDPRTS